MSKLKNHALKSFQNILAAQQSSKTGSTSNLVLIMKLFLASNGSNLHKPFRRKRWIRPTGNCSPARVDLVLLVLFPAALAPFPRPDILVSLVYLTQRLKLLGGWRVYANHQSAGRLYSCHVRTCSELPAVDWFNIVKAVLTGRVNQHGLFAATRWLCVS